MSPRCDTIDRKARDEMAEAIERYLREGTTAFQMDDHLSDIAGRTKDSTVQDVADAMWFHYDDVKDHKVVASKEEWDYFQRLLLVLRSEGRMELTRRRRWRWTIRQCIALGCLLLFLAAVRQKGIGWELAPLSIPFGIVSMALAYWHSRESRRSALHALPLYPFSSVAELFRVHRSAPAFRKLRYRATLQGRTIRSNSLTWIMCVPLGIAWLLYSPVPLLFQSLPERDCTTQVVIP